jgi:peptide/nickel transport system substrate-binding protein
MSRFVDDTLAQLVHQDRLSRRRLLQAAAVGGTALGMTGMRVINPFAPGVGAQEASPEAGQGVAGGSLRAGFEANPDDLNPFTMTSLVSALVTEQVYDTLFIFDQNLVSQPNLCVNFEAPDETTYRFTIAENATFSDGSRVTSEDVKFTLEGYKDPELGARSWAQAIDTIDIVDETTVQVNLANPFAPMLGYLSWHFNPIISKAFYEANEGNLQTVTMGSGPFILEEFVPDQSIKFVKNPNYWREGLPYLDEMEYVVLPDDQARVAALRGGEVQNSDFLDYQPVESFVDKTDRARKHG